MANLRCYRDLGNGYGAPLPIVYNQETGKTMPYPLTDNSAKPLSMLQGHIIYPAMNVVDPTIPSAIIPTEGAGGSKGSARVEYADVAADSSMEAINLTIDNTSKTAAQMQAITGNSSAPAYTATTQKIVVFDGVGLLKIKLGQTAANPLSAGVVFSGDYDERTNLVYTQISQSIPLDLHKLTLSINNENLYSQLGIELQEAKVNNSSPSSKKLDINSIVTSGDFNQKVRTFENFRFQANGVTGMIVTVPAECVIGLNMLLSGTGKAFNIVK